MEILKYPGATLQYGEDGLNTSCEVLSMLVQHTAIEAQEIGMSNSAELVVSIKASVQTSLTDLKEELKSEGKTVEEVEAFLALVNITGYALGEATNGIGSALISAFRISSMSEDVQYGDIHLTVPTIGQTVEIRQIDMQSIEVKLDFNYLIHSNLILVAIETSLYNILRSKLNDLANFLILHIHE